MCWIENDFEMFTRSVSSVAHVKSSKNISWKSFLIIRTKYKEKKQRFWRVKMPNHDGWIIPDVKQNI